MLMRSQPKYVANHFLLTEDKDDDDDDMYWKHIYQMEK